MLIYELFEDTDFGSDDDSSGNNGGQMMQRLRQAALDVITPLLGQNVPFVTMNQMIDSLSDSRFGIVITPALMMSILDPDSVKAVEKIEGDRIYLAEPQNAGRGIDQNQKQKDDDHVGDMAVNQINNELKGKQ